MNALYRWAYTLLAAVLILFVLIPSAHAQATWPAIPVPVIPAKTFFTTWGGQGNALPGRGFDSVDEAAQYGCDPWGFKAGHILTVPQYQGWVFTFICYDAGKIASHGVAFREGFCPDLLPYFPQPGGFYSSLSKYFIASGTFDDGAGGLILSNGWSGYFGCPIVNFNPQKTLGPSCIRVGNPIDPITGNKYQVERDYVGTGSSPLKFERHYNSSGAAISHWTHTYSSKIDRDPYPWNSVSALRPDGRVLQFKLTGTAGIPDADINDRVTVLDDGYIYITENDDIEFYGPTGVLQSITSREGMKQTLTHDAAGLLIKVTDSFGRALLFQYDVNDRRTKMTVPGGGVYAYAYDAFGNEISVTYQDGKKKTYIYNEQAFTDNQSFPHALTGIIDENGSRYATYQYDYKARAWKTSHAGGIDAVSVSFSDTFNGPDTSFTDALGKTRSLTYQFINAVPKMTTASSAAAACNITNSAASYDTKGNALSRNDFIGKKVCYRYTATRNLESVRAESILAAESCSTVLTTLPARSGVRKVSTAWHAKWRLPVKIAEPNRLTYFAYNGDGGIYCAPSSAAGVLCKQTVRTTTDATGQKGFAAPLTGTPAIWQYTYNQFGQELTAVDPLGKFITTTYYANGNTHTVTNAAGEVITINAYDSGGRPTSMTDADGTIGLTYWPRGWLRTLAEASGTTNYTDDGTGQLTKMLRPDGSYLIYTYDAAHRLTQVKDELGERIVYTHDLTGIITKVETFDANGALTKVRYYDAAESVRTAQFNRQPLFKIEYHGNWCGPDWTGGFKREYGQIGMWEDILTPTDALDRCCYTHDICYWECRCDHGCSVDKRKSCMKICDNALAGCAAASGHRGGLLWLKFNYTDPFKEPDQPTCYGKKD